MIRNLQLKYNAEGTTLRRSQLRMLEILHYVAKLCDENDLKYWLTDGTLLGAYRHKGFIPWDDDLDIGMMRKDMLKLREIIQEDSDSNFIFQDHTTDSHYYYSYPKIRDKYSVCESDVAEETMFKYKGIWIDIFPFEESDVHIQKLAFYTNTYGRRFLTTKNCLHYVANIRYYLNEFLLFPCLRLLSKTVKRKRVCLNRSLGCEYFYPQKKEDLFPLSKLEFENSFFCVPHHTSEVLIGLYGKNFNEIPPENNRINHKLKVSFLTHDEIER